MLFIFRGLSISVSMAVNVLCFVCLWSRSLDRLQVFWKRNGVRLTAGVDSFGRRLVISKPTSVDVGLYVCEAAFRNSSQRAQMPKRTSPYWVRRFFVLKQIFKYCFTEIALKRKSLTDLNSGILLN